MAAAFCRCQRSRALPWWHQDPGLPHGIPIDDAARCGTRCSPRRRRRCIGHALAMRCDPLAPSARTLSGRPRTTRQKRGHAANSWPHGMRPRPPWPTP
eukprot:8288799-Pyramimonas_sp.AAC.1